MRVLLFILFLALPLTAVEAKSRRARPTPTPAQTTTQRQWIEGARAKIAQLQKEHDEAIAQANAAYSANQSAQEQITTLDGQVKTITSERDEWVKYGNKQHDLYVASLTKVQAQKAAILRRDLIITFLTLAIAAWAALKYYFHVPFL